MLENEIKVLLVSPIPPPVGGVATWTKQYIEWSKFNDLNVDIVDTSVVGKRAEKINSKTNVVDETRRSMRIFKSLNIKIKRFKPHIVHINTSCGKLGIIRDFLCAKISKIKKRKVVIHYRCNIEDQIGSKVTQKYFLRRLANIADKNIVLNSTSKRYLSLKSNTSNIILIPNFIDESFILTGSKYIRNKITNISYVGHIMKTKGVYEIIEVAKKLPGIVFKLAGPVADEIYKIQTPSNIIFMGSIAKQQVKELLSDTDIFLFPSYSEGFANALLEAMASGLPIITTPVGANHDMIESSGGIFVKVGDSNGLIKAIYELEDPSIRVEMSKWNINKVKHEYTMEKVMSKMLSLYNMIISESE